jgi:predicted ATPase
MVPEDFPLERFIVISGCSGGGKSTLLAELARRGHATVEEPGRRIVEEEKVDGAGSALPWVDLAAFARRAVRMAREDRIRAAARSGLVFFDRGLVDAAAALQHATGEPALAELGPNDRYHQRVFLVPPWADIYVTDADRPHSFDSAVEEYSRLVDAYAGLGYVLDLLPKTDAASRADYVLQRLAG